MLDAMTPEQWQEWQAKDIVEPIGHRGTQEVLAMMAVLIAQWMGHEGVDHNTFLYWRQPQGADGTVSHDVAAMALQLIGAKRDG